jgi:hypothetical protein
MFIDGFGEQYRPAAHGHVANHGARHEYNDNDGHDDASSRTNNDSGCPHAWRRPGDRRRQGFGVL